MPGSPTRFASDHALDDPPFQPFLALDLEPDVLELIEGVSCGGGNSVAVRGSQIVLVTGWNAFSGQSNSPTTIVRAGPRERLPSAAGTLPSVASPSGRAEPIRPATAGL